MRLRFWKLSGAGNDFIAFDNRAGIIPEDAKPHLAKTLCRRRHSIGADGMLLIEPSKNARFTMRIFNPDGTEAATCGNASRCIARLAFETRLAPQDMNFETRAGIYRAHVDGEFASVSLTEPTDLKMDITLGEEWMPAPRIHFVKVGVPHIVLFVKNLDTCDIIGIGGRLRRHPHFQPEGTNVNFVEAIDGHNLRIRTYERGVEDETLACGTGCVASAVIAGILGIAKSPTRLYTKGGHINVVHYTLDGERGTNILLEGEAHIVFASEVDVDLGL